MVILIKVILIKALTKDDVTYTQDNGILQTAKDFYSGLFTSRNPSQEAINMYLNDIDIHKLSEEEQTSVMVYY